MAEFIVGCLKSLLRMWPFVIVLGALLLYLRAKRRFTARRKAELAEFAGLHELSFDPDAQRMPDPETPGFELITNSASLLERSTFFEYSNLIYGGGKGFFFDLRRTYGRSGEENITLAMFELPRPAPRFRLRPENLMDKVDAAVGFQDLDLAGFPGFSGRYRLTAEDPAAVRAFFAAGPAAWFGERPGWNVEAAGAVCIAYKSRSLVEISGYIAFINETRAVAEVLAGQP